LGDGGGLGVEAFLRLRDAQVRGLAPAAVVRIPFRLVEPADKVDADRRVQRHHVVGVELVVEGAEQDGVPAALAFRSPP
jgi:hypothetical protein